MNSLSEMAFLAFIIRLVGAFFFVLVLIKQIQYRRAKLKDGLNSLRNTMIALAIIPFVYNFVALLNNYLRFTTGSTNQFVNNLSFQLSAIATTSTAILLWAIYSSRSAD